MRVAKIKITIINGVNIIGEPLHFNSYKPFTILRMIYKYLRKYKIGK